MAIACLRLFTVLPLLPDLRVPFLRRRIALSTRFDAALPYFLLPEDFLAAIPSPSPISMSRRYLGRLAHVVPREPTGLAARSIFLSPRCGIRAPFPDTHA